MTPATATQPALASLLDNDDEGDIEAIRNAIAALAAGEEVDDVEAYKSAARRLKFTAAHETIAVDAMKTFPDFVSYPEQFEEQLAEWNAKEAAAAKEEMAHDLALTAARNRRRHAQAEIRNRIAEQREVRAIIMFNPLLLGATAEAIAAAQVPALTLQEVCRASNHPEPMLEAARVGREKYANLTDPVVIARNAKLATALIDYKPRANPAVVTKSERLQ